jgi:hypothetical protein
MLSTEYVSHSDGRVEGFGPYGAEMESYAGMQYTISVFMF